MGLEGVNNQCIHNISASCLFKSTICVIHTVVPYFFHINNNFGGPRKSRNC